MDNQGKNLVMKNLVIRQNHIDGVVLEMPIDLVAEKKTLERIFVKGKDRFYWSILAANIVYVKAEGAKVLIYVEENNNGKMVIRQHLNYCSLSDFLQQFPHPDLLRVHRSYVINVQKVIARNERELKLSSGETLPISRTHRPQINRLLPLLKSQ